MPEDYIDAHKTEIRFFNSLVKPYLEKRYYGTFTLIEDPANDPQSLAAQLDMKAGIDCIYEYDDKLYGVSIRVQEGHNFKTFTVRKARESGAITETEKRFSDNDRCIKAHYILQAYVSEGKLASYAISTWGNIKIMIDEGLVQVKSTGPDQIGASDFYIVDWATMKVKGLNIEYEDLTRQKLSW